MRLLLCGVILPLRGLNGGNLNFLGQLLYSVDVLVVSRSCGVVGELLDKLLVLDGIGLTLLALYLHLVL